MRRPIAVCFDLDGVLIDTMPHHARAWQAALNPLGLRISRRAIYQWEGEPGLVTARRLLRRSAGHQDQAECRNRWGSGRGTGPRATPGAVQALLRDKERRFAALARGVRVAQSWRTLLRQLKQRQVRLGLVTGTSRQEVERVVPAAVRRAFEVIVTGDQVTRGKPDPEPYRTTCRHLRTRPADTLVIENAPYGIRSARRAGIGLILALASSLPARYLHEADLVVTSPQQLRQLLVHGLTPTPTCR